MSVSKQFLSVMGCVMMFGAAAQAAQVDPYVTNANTVVLYHLDSGTGTNTTADASGNGLTLTSNASFSPFAGVSGPTGLGTAGTFPKTNGGYQLTRTLTTPELSLFDTTHFTIEAWVRNPDLVTTGDHNGVLAYRGATGRFQFTVLGPSSGASAGRLRLDYNKASDGSFYGSAASSALTWETDVWYHVVVTYDANTAAANDSIITYYRNAFGDPDAPLLMVGQLTNQPDIKPLDLGGSLNLGGFESNPTRSFGGNIDEVRYSNAVLSTFNLTVPTPAALPAGLAMMGMMMMRRRK
ncbi:MAG: hypothetical protein GC162_00085 [Planctomycetes bacterium]|nr:hypothetical protein [Planctomycetota bacterium]